MTRYFAIALFAASRLLAQAAEVEIDALLAKVGQDAVLQSDLERFSISATCSRSSSVAGRVE